MPVQIVSAVKLENEDIVDLRFRPDPAIQTEQEEKE